MVLKWHRQCCAGLLSNKTVDKTVTFVPASDSAE